MFKSLALWPVGGSPQGATGACSTGVVDGAFTTLGLCTVGK